LKFADNPEARQRFERVRKLAIYTSIIIGAVLIAISITTGSTPTQDNDIRNWVSLVIEVALAIFITVTVVIYSNYQQGRLKELIDGIHNMEKSQIEIENKLLKVIEQQENDRKNRFDFHIDALRWYLDILLDQCVFLEKESNSEPTITENITSALTQISRAIESLKLEIQRSVGVVEPQILENIDNICWNADKIGLFADVDGVKKLHKDNCLLCSNVRTLVEPVLQKFPKSKNLFPPDNF
jgi:hypothetical protein